MTTTARTFPVRFEQPAAGTRTDAVARDVSLGGMFVVTSAPADEGTLLVIEIDLEGVKVSVDARVLRREPDGMAVVFIDLPDDVGAVLSAAVTPTSARTILGVGGGNIKATIQGVAVPPTPVAVPSVQTTTPGIAAPVEAKKAAATITNAKAKPKAKAAKDDGWERKEVGEAEEAKRASSTPPPPPPKGGSGARWFFLLLVLGGGAAAYYYREPLRREIDAAMAPTAAPTPTATPTPAPTPVPTPAPTPSATASATASASAVSVEEVKEAGAPSAKDAGAHDGGAHRDAGSHK